MDKLQIAKEYRNLLAELDKVGEYFKKLDKAFYRVLNETPQDEKKLAKLEQEYDKISRKIDSLSADLQRLKNQL